MLENMISNYSVIELNHEISKDIPRFDLGEDYQEIVVKTVEEDGFCVKRHLLHSQYSTHIDVGLHFVVDGKSLEAVPVSEFILPLCVINKVNQVVENNDYLLTLQDVIQYEEENGRIPENSFVAFASGWSQRWNNHEAFYNKDQEGVEHTPGWSIEALEFLHTERKVTAIGHETLNTDRGLDIALNNSFKSQSYWLTLNKYQIEVMNNLWKLPAKGSYIFVGAPKVVGATGFPVRVLALVPND